MPGETNPAIGPEKELHTARQLISQYAMAFDLLTRIAHSATEKQAIDSILQVFDMLFSPRILFYAAHNPAGQPAQIYSLSAFKEAAPAVQARLSGFRGKYAWTDSGTGFQIMIRYNEKDLGILVIDEVAFPDQKERYLNLSLSMAGVCGLAIENAKRYQIIRDAEDQLRTEKEKLEKALSEVKTLSGLIPICSHCKKIRDDKGYWNQVEAYIQQHSDAKFSHGICRDCMQLHYAEYVQEKK
jgi:transcriptional regulator with GAF, ATPase, and Fis domain